MCSNVQASNSSQVAIEKLIKDGMQCPSKTKPIKYNVAKNEVSPPVCCRTLYFLAIDNEKENTSTTNCPKKNFTKLQERRRFFLRHSKEIRENSVCALRKQCNARFQNDNCSLFSPPKNRARNLCRSQASKTENSEVAQIAYEVAEQFPQLHTGERMEEYNDTRRWRCYEAALLMKKNEIRTDEEAPLTTPVDASVLEYYRASPRGSLQNCVLRSDRNSF